MNFDPANLPTIPTAVRKWIYFLFLLALTVLNSIDAFYDTGDPWWLPGALRAMNVVGLFVAAVALVNARPTPAEQAKAQAKADEQWVDPAAPAMRDGDLGLPDNLRRPSTDEFPPA